MYVNRLQFVIGMDTNRIHIVSMNAKELTQRQFQIRKLFGVEHFCLAHKAAAPKRQGHVVGGRQFPRDLECLVQVTANNRMCAIGAHEDVAVVRSIVGTVDGHAVVVLVETIHLFVHVDALLGHLTAEKVVQVSTGHNILKTPSTIIDSEQRNRTALLQCP